MQENQDIEIKYEKGKDYRTALATGIFGGMTPNGLLNMHFYTDRVTLPSSSTVVIPDGNSQKAYEKPNPLMGPTREVHFGVVVSIEFAKKMVEWMNKRIHDFENQQNTDS